jgi:hypothetical protein
MITLGILCRLPEERISQRLNPVVKFTIGNVKKVSKIHKI